MQAPGASEKVGLSISSDGTWIALLLKYYANFLAEKLSDVQRESTYSGFCLTGVPLLAVGDG